MRYQKLTVVLSAICFVLISHLSAKENRVVAIVPFSNQGTADQAWMARGIEEILYDKLFNLHSITGFEKETLDRILRAEGVRTSSDLTVRKAFAIGRETGADVIFAGSYLVNGQSLEMTYRVVSTYTGGDVFRKKYTGSISDIFQMNQNAISEIMGIMAIPLNNQDIQSLSVRPTKSIQAFESYCKAYMELQKGANMDVVAGYFSNAVAQDPDFWEAQYNLGVIYYNFDKYDKALSQFVNVARNNPNFFKPYYGMGIIYYLKGEYPESIRQFNKVLAINPEHDRSLYYLGRVYVHIDSLEKGIDYLMKSAEINPNYAPTYYYLGEANTSRGWYKTAIQQLKKSIQLNPNNYRAHNLLGENYYNLQRFDEAIFEYKQAVKLKQNFSTGYFNLGNTVYKKGALEEIVDAYLEILETRYSSATEQKENSKILNDIKGMRKEFTGRSREVYDTMISSYKSALKYEPGFFEAAFNLALTYDNIGEPDSAIFYYKKAIDSNPRLVRAYMKLGRLYERRKDYDDALKYFKEVVKIEPSYFAGNPRLGEPYRYINIVETVLNEYLTKYDLNPKDPNTLLVLARIFSSLGRYKQAEEYYQQIVQIDPGNSRARQELQDIRLQKRKL